MNGKWLMRVLVGMLVVAAVLAGISLLSVKAGPPEPEGYCDYFSCRRTNIPCYWNGYTGYYEICRYEPYPAACPRCPSPCEWVQCRWW
jgi:hypothetical protein